VTIDITLREGVVMKDADVPEADAIEQNQEWADSDSSTDPKIPIDVPEADAIEQAQDVPGDDEEDRR
jgi:hypothetical protein